MRIKMTIDQYVESVEDINWDSLLSEQVEIEYADRGAQVTELGYVAGDNSKKVFLYHEIHNCFVAFKDMGFIERMLTDKQKIPKKNISRVTILIEDKNYKIDPNFKENSLKQKESTRKAYLLLKETLELAEQGTFMDLSALQKGWLELMGEPNFPHGFPMEYDSCWSLIKRSVYAAENMYPKEEREEMLISARSRLSSIPDPAK